LKENALGAIIERESASWPENTRRDYHALTRGWVLSELVRRVDPQKRTLGEFIEQEIATPLGADFYIGL
jgi:CubicO group peptidase (beta-lactamase class C family)